MSTSNSQGASQFPQHQFRACPHDRTVTESMYRMVISDYPALQSNAGYKRLFAYDALGPHRFGRNSIYPIISAWMCADFEGKLSDLRGHRYSAIAFLKKYQQDVDPAFKWSRHSKQDKMARVILESGTRDIARQYAANTSDEQRRWLMSGLKLTDRTRAATNNATRERVSEETREYMFGDQYIVGEYLRDLPYSLFKRQVDKHYQEAWDWALHYGNEQDLMTLEAARDLPKPYYNIIQPNARLFPTMGLATIKSEIRHILLQDWSERDLMNCQAAIVAGIWHIDTVQDLLAGGTSIWDYLLYELGIRESQRKKGKEAVRPLVYSLVNGMDSHDLRGFAREQLASLDRTNKLTFMSLPLIRDMERAKENAVHRIEAERGAETPYGWLERDEDTSMGSFLAFVVQSYELALVAAAFKVAAGRNDFSIALYQFDGLTVTSDTPYVLNTLDKAVQARGLELGIEARLR